nr:hypothetical protein [Bacillus mycoides]
MQYICEKREREIIITLMKRSVRIGYFNPELMKNNLDQEEAIQIIKNYIKRLAETYEDKEYAAEVIERVYNEDTTCEDIDFILDCKKLT